MREKCTTRLGGDSTQKPGKQQAYPALNYEGKMHNESKGTGRNSIGYADVQIKSARNGRRDSLIKSREQDTYNSASKIPKATPCGQSPMGTPNAQDIILWRS